MAGELGRFRYLADQGIISAAATATKCGKLEGVGRALTGLLQQQYLNDVRPPNTLPEVMVGGAILHSELPLRGYLMMTKLWMVCGLHTV